VEKTSATAVNGSKSEADANLYYSSPESAAGITGIRTRTGIQCPCGQRGHEFLGQTDQVSVFPDDIAELAWYRH
jgi:hypothetical protein